MTAKNVFFCLLWVTACTGTHEADDAGLSLPDAAHDDVSASSDAALDAAPNVEGLICTGRPVPEGLSCLVQDPSVQGPCDGHGGVVFDGSQCRIARGGECAAGGRGAFDSLEECGVTCALADRCVQSRVFVAPLGEPVAACEAPVECYSMGLDRDRVLPISCTAWGQFARLATVPSSELPYPAQWDILWSLTLASDALALRYVVCCRMEDGDC